MGSRGSSDVVAATVGLSSKSSASENSRFLPNEVSTDSSCLGKVEIGLSRLLALEMRVPVSIGDHTSKSLVPFVFPPVLTPDLGEKEVITISKEIMRDPSHWPL